MHKPKFLFKLTLLIFALSAANTFAQTEPKANRVETCYEVILQTVVASNKAPETQKVPANLSNVVKKLKNLYDFSAYTVTETFIQRTSGSIDYKSVLNEANSVQDKNVPVFSEWSLRNLQDLGILQGRKTIQFDSFRFGARVPVVLQSVKTEGEKNAPLFSYEQIGITTSKFYLPENEPTVLGSLATAKPNELMFLVLTVKPVD